MPKKGYHRKLTWQQIIDLFDQGRYQVDFETGIISSGKTGKPIFTFTGNDDEHLWCRLFCFPGMRSVPVSNLVWVVKTRTPIPHGFEVHHRNLDPADNRWSNLICLHKDDHRKIHREFSLEVIEEPF